jgi:hypothetical protein
MATKIIPLVFGIGVIISIAEVHPQLLTGTPAESASPSKHRAQKTTETTPPAQSDASSATESPVASPTPRRVRRKTTAELSPTPSPTPIASPTPRKFRLKFPHLFKSKRARSPTPAGVNPETATGSSTGAGGNAAPDTSDRRE